MFNLTSYQMPTKRKEMLCFLSFIKLTNTKINDYFPPRALHFARTRPVCVYLRIRNS